MSHSPGKDRFGATRARRKKEEGFVRLAAKALSRCSARRTTRFRDTGVNASHNNALFLVSWMDA
jgi:hypothetical protein